MKSLEKFEGTSREAIGARLELTRRAYELSQTQLCKQTGLSNSAYNNYEQGYRIPNLESALVLCEIYNLTLDWIYRGDTAGLPLKLADALRSLKQEYLKK